MTGTEPEGRLQVEIVYERPSANKVICHARCVSVGRSVFPGDAVLPVDGPVDAGSPPARVVRMHRPPFGEFSELPPSGTPPSISRAPRVQTCRGSSPT